MAKILIIDDEQILRNTLKERLDLDAYETFTAENGPEGLMKFQKEKPDIVILDIKMPGMNGIEVLKRIKKESKKTEVIMITGHGEMITAIEAMKEGAFHYIQKPIEYDELDIEIKHALAKQNTQKKLAENLLHLKKIIDEKSKELSLRIKAEKALEYRIETEKLISCISTTFMDLGVEDIEGSIHLVLQKIGEFTRTDRCYVFMFFEKEKKTDNIYEWCADGIKPHINRRKGLSLFSLFSEWEKDLINPNINEFENQSFKISNSLKYEDLSLFSLFSEWDKHFIESVVEQSGPKFAAFPWLRKKMELREVVYIPRIDDLPSEANKEKEAFQLAAIKSHINLPMISEGRLVGFLALDTVREEKTWPDEDIRMLKMVGEIIAQVMEHKKAREISNRFRAILDHASEAIFLIKPEDGHFVDINKTAETQLGYTRKELISMGIKDVDASSSSQTIEQWQKFVRNIKDHRGETVLFSSTYKRKDNSAFPAEVSVSCKTFAGKDYFLFVVRDVTEQMRAKKVIESQKQQLIQADKMISIGTMAAGVAHEINNPLNVAVGDVHLFARDFRDILDLINLISKASLPPDTLKEIEKLKKDIDLPYIEENFKKKITRCEDAMKRIKEIVQNLRDFSSVDKAEIVDFDVSRGIESTLQLVPKKYKQNIEIKTEYASVPTIPCFGNQMNQVFMNIIVNALQAMKDGGMMKIETSSDDKHVYIKFVDNGPGIPGNKLKKIFDPFYTTKPVGEGTGLGLSITYSIIEKHGGVISVVNNPDKGVTFTIKLLKTGVKVI